MHRTVRYLLITEQSVEYLRHIRLWRTVGSNDEDDVQLSHCCVRRRQELMSEIDLADQEYMWGAVDETRVRVPGRRRRPTVVNAR